MVKLIGSNYMKSKSFLNLIEGSLRMRLNHMVKQSKPTKEFISN